MKQKMDKERKNPFYCLKKKIPPIVVNPGETRAFVLIGIVDDDLFEILEFFEVHYEIEKPSNA